MQTTRLNSTFLTGATVAPRRILTHAEVAEQFIDAREARKQLLKFVNNYFDQRGCE